jgi:hypothetical protein
MSMLDQTESYNFLYFQKYFKNRLLQHFFLLDTPFICNLYRYNKQMA